MKKLLIMAACAVMLLSCEKDNNSENSNANSEYLPLAIGNYWITRDFYTDQNGKLYSPDVEDSTIIVSDTSINGSNYKKFNTYRISTDRKAQFAISNFYRDSAKCLINNEGKILFSEKNFEDVLLVKSEIIDSDTLFTVKCKMEKIDSSFTVPAGSFTNVLNLKGLVNCNPKFTNIPNPRYNNNVYAKNVGKIYSSGSYFYDGGTREIKLIRYKVNN